MSPPARTAPSTVPTDRAPSEVRRALRLLVAAFGALLVAAATLFLAELRDRALDEAGRKAADTARLLEEHLSRTLRATDFILERAARLHGRGPEDASHELAALSRGLPERGSLWLVDDRGETIAGSTAFPLARRVNIADRAWFPALAAGRERVVGALTRARYDDTLIFTLSRRLVDGGGGFTGAVVAAIDASYFTDFYRNLDLGPNSATAIFDMDGRVILRQPHPQRYADTTVAGSPTLAAARERPADVIRVASPLDGVERIVAYRTLSEFGIYVTCSLAVDDALAGWRRAAVGLAVMLAVLLAALGSLAAFAFRSLAREEAVLAGLERAVRERTDEARAQADEAQRANVGKTRFLAAASHDLRQPLQAAGMFAEVLSHRLEDPGQLAVVDKLRLSIEATNALLTTLLDVSNLEAGRVEPTMSSFPLAPLLASLADQLEPEAAGRGLAIRVVPTSARVVSDPVLLERLLRNLAVNAVRYTEAGGVLLGCRRRGAMLAVQVVDTGIGIPADKLAAVFEDFTRLDPPAGAKPQQSRGLGLGLGVVRRMAGVLGHAVEVRSVPGRGSCFTVLVPLADVPAARPLAGVTEA